MENTPNVPEITDKTKIHIDSSNGGKGYEARKELPPRVYTGKDLKEVHPQLDVFDNARLRIITAENGGRDNGTLTDVTLGTEGRDNESLVIRHAVQQAALNCPELFSELRKIDAVKSQIGALKERMIQEFIKGETVTTERSILTNAAFVELQAEIKAGKVEDLDGEIIRKREKISNNMQIFVFEYRPAGHTKIVQPDSGIDETKKKLEEEFKKILPSTSAQQQV